MKQQLVALPGSAFRQRAATAGLDVDVPLRYGPFTLTLDRYELMADGEPVELSPLRLELLAVFFAAPERVWSRGELNDLAGGGSAESRRIDVRLARLRAALGIDIFRTVTGRGWILRSADQLAPR
jgi:DNA-binding response OmpR family regulator